MNLCFKKKEKSKISWRYILPNLPLKKYVLLKIVRLYSRHISTSATSPNFSNICLEILSLGLSRREPFNRRIYYVNCFWTFTGFYLVHICGIAKKWILIMTCRKVTFCLGCFNAEELLDSIDFDGAISKTF